MAPDAVTHPEVHTMKDPNRALKVTMIAAMAVSLAVAAMGCGSMGRAGSQVDRSASKVGHVFKN